MNKSLALILLGLTSWLSLLPATTCRAEDVIYYRPDPGGFIVDWLLSSQHRFPFAYLGASLNYDALSATGGEKSCAPRPGTKAGSGTNWEERHFQPAGNGGLCSFQPCAYSFTYAFVYLYSDREQTEVQLLTGSDDALLVLLNGQVVQRVQMQRGTAVDQDRALVTLHKGWNRLLCKVDDVSGGHGLCVRLKTPAGQPLQDYKICLARPAEGAVVRFVDGVVYEADAARLLKSALKLSAEQGDLEGAASKCREVVAGYPKAQSAAEALYQVGVLEARQGKTDRALANHGRLLVQYPYSRWVEDALLSQAELLAGRKDHAAAEKALTELLTSRPRSQRASEAMLRLAGLQTLRRDLNSADAVFLAVRQKYANTVEAVIALEGLADNQKARGNAAEAAKLYQQVLDDCQKLSEGKYVFFVNVQAALKRIADSARAKMASK